MASPIKNNPYNAAQHERFFAEFVQAVQDVGGTTPHMLMTVEMCNRQKSESDKLWFAGCYAFVYNFATAEIIFNRWRPGTKYGSWSSQEELANWIRENWAGIKFRKERKAARSPEHLAKCMDDYYEFMQRIPSAAWRTSKELNSRQRYDLAFDDLCASVKYMGRYIAIRWVEVIRRVYGIDMQMPDLRAEDGDHPRKALALIFPEHEAVLTGGNSDYEISETNRLVEVLKKRLEEKYGVTTDYYTMQSLLCEYKQSVLSMKQFPGKSIDSETAYYEKVLNYWGEDYAKISKMFEIRKKIFPAFSLGELNGWGSSRPELGETLRKYGYTWSDMIYDYVATVSNLGNISNPIKKEGKSEILSR